MLEFDRRAPRESQPASTLTLPWERRRVTRQKVRLDDGRDAGLFLSRGEVLRGGDRLATATGEVIGIVAAPEDVMIVRAADPPALARAAYHLGNRHVAVEVGEGWLKLERDHVLRGMLEGLGVGVEDATLPFEPESGAYAHAPPGHSHPHGPDPANGRGPAETLAARIATPRRSHRGGAHG